MFRRVSAAALTALISTSSFAFTSPNEQGEFPGRNPASQNAGCSNAITLKEKTLYSRWGADIGKFQLRYSAACEGVWVRMIAHQERDVQLSVVVSGNWAGGTGSYSEYGRIVWSSFADVDPGEYVGGSVRINLYGNDGIASTSFDNVKVPENVSFSLLRGSYAVNAYSPRNYRNVNMWEYRSADEDQKWEWLGSLLRRTGTNYCLNAPSRSNGGNVFMWACSASDADQQWRLAWVSGSYANIALGNTGYCLNAHAPARYSNVNLWECAPNDSDQRFRIK